MSKKKQTKTRNFKRMKRQLKAIEIVILMFIGKFFLKYRNCLI